MTDLRGASQKLGAGGDVLMKEKSMQSMPVCERKRSYFSASDKRREGRVRVCAVTENREEKEKQMDPLTLLPAF